MAQMVVVAGIYNCWETWQIYSGGNDSNGELSPDDVWLKAILLLGKREQECSESRNED